MPANATANSVSSKGLVKTGQFRPARRGSPGGSAVISTAGHTPGKCRIWKDHVMKRNTESWAFPQPEQNPYQYEESCDII